MGSGLDVPSSSQLDVGCRATGLFGPRLTVQRRGAHDNPEYRKAAKAPHDSSKTLRGSLDEAQKDQNSLDAHEGCPHHRGARAGNTAMTDEPVNRVRVLETRIEELERLCAELVPGGGDAGSAGDSPRPTLGRC